MATTPTPTASLTPQAVKGVDYLRTINPTLADTISKSFAPASSSPIDASTIGSTSNISVPPPPTPTLPDYTKVAVSPPITNTARQDQLDSERSQIITDITADQTRLGTKSARKAELETQAGLPGLNQQLNEINSLIRSTQAEALAATEKSENRLLPRSLSRGSRQPSSVSAR